MKRVELDMLKVNNKGMNSKIINQILIHSHGSTRIGCLVCRFSSTKLHQLR